MDDDFAQARLGMSGRRRIDGDAYPTPTLTTAALVLGLGQAGLRLPSISLDSSGGEGQLALTVTALLPGCNVRLSDINPQPRASGLYATMAPVDATIPAALESMLRVTGARAVISNPPFAKDIYPKILANLLWLLRRGELDLIALMQREQRHLNTPPAARETALEPLYAGMIAMPWRAFLWPRTPESKQPTGGYVWHVYARPERPSRVYSVFTVLREEAEAALAKALAP